MISIAIEKKISGKYGRFELKVDTAFQTNQLTRIMGPSGVGKTTLLKILAGLITPDSGTIKVGHEVWFDSKSKYSKKVQDRSIGFVFQDYALFPNLTVAEHLEYGTTDQSYISRLLDLGELAPFRKRLPKQLSGGQQQRLAILRALSTQPKLLLMDEPFSALDEDLKNRMIVGLKQLFLEQQTTVILITHQDNDLSNENTFNLTFTKE